MAQAYTMNRLHVHRTLPTGQLVAVCMIMLWQRTHSRVAFFLTTSTLCRWGLSHVQLKPRHSSRTASQRTS